RLGRRNFEFRDAQALLEGRPSIACDVDHFSHLDACHFDDVGGWMNLSGMSFDHGILNLANWVGNVIMPTLAAVFIINAILQFSKGQDFAHSMYGALAALMISG